MPSGRSWLMLVPMPNSDSVDLRVIADVTNGTGWTGFGVASPQAAGGFPVIGGGSPREGISGFRPTGAGSDFPGSSDDRERGKFRSSGTPRLTQVAVVDEFGQPITRTTDDLLAEWLLWQKAGVIALVLQEDGTEFSVEDLLSEASEF